MAAVGSVAVHHQGRGRSARFAAACGVLSQYVKAAERATAAAAAAVEARPVAVQVLPLMPGADVPAHEPEAEAGPAPAAQMTISYGGRVLVLDDVPADRAAELLRLAAAQAGAAEGDLPVARKASLQRFMEKRRCRAAARGTAPYSRPDADADAAPSSFPDHLKLAL
jgi:jasmonate ZIM domain-containing protein